MAPLDPVVTEALGSLSSDLTNLNRVVIEHNQLSLTSSPSEYSDFHFNDILNSVTTLLGARLSHIRIESDVDCSFRPDSSVLSSIFLNLMMNALENFKQRETRAPVH